MKKIRHLSKFVILLALTFLISDRASSQMFWNQSASFNSADSDHVSVPHSSLLNITGSFTVECWVKPLNALSPAIQVLVQKRNPANINTGYSLHLFNGKPAVRSNGLYTIIGNSVLPDNKWTHISGRYNSATNTFTTFVNGVTDNSSTWASAEPVSNSDSVLVGYGKGLNSPFSGELDDIRIWNRPLSAAEISSYYRTTLASNSGIYNGLVLSLTFQNKESTGQAFTTEDQSGSNNNGFNRGCGIVSMENEAYKTVSCNESGEFDGSNDYIAGQNNVAINPVPEITMEAWIFPRTTANSTIIHKGSDNGSVTNFSLGVTNGVIVAGLKQNFGFISGDTIQAGKWTHVAFTYFASTGIYCFYINGKRSIQSINNIGLISSSSDSLYIGGTMSLPDFNGFIDEVRITERAKSGFEVARNVYRSIDKSNEDPADDAVYNLDGIARSNTGQGPDLFFRNNASFSHPACKSAQPVSPLLRMDDLNYPKSFYIKSADLRIPVSGKQGLVEDVLDIYEDEPIDDVNIFVALNHKGSENIRIVINAPNGEYALLFMEQSTSGEDNNIVTIFDDDADTLFPNSYTTLTPSIGAYENINMSFTGTTRGQWKIYVYDNFGADTGRLYAWGLQFNNSTEKSRLLQTSYHMEGFYDPLMNMTIRDTVQYNIRMSTPPYQIVESIKFRIPESGEFYIPLQLISDFSEYYIQVLHRNSIEIWSSETVVFSPFTSQASNRFTFPKTNTYGDNVKLVDTSPLRYAAFGGDVNQDETVDASDVSMIDNDAANFVSGYVVSDLTGDDFVDGTDFAIADNNAATFVSAITP